MKPNSIIVVFRNGHFHEIVSSEDEAKRLLFIRAETGKMTYQTITDAAKIEEYEKIQQRLDWIEKHTD